MAVGSLSPGFLYRDQPTGNSLQPMGKRQSVRVLRRWKPLMASQVVSGVGSCDFLPLALPAEDRFAHLFHGQLRGLPGLLRAIVEDFQDALRVLLKFEATGTDRLNPGDQMIGHLGF